MQHINTLVYYDNHANEFYKNTLDVEEQWITSDARPGRFDLDLSYGFFSKSWHFGDAMETVKWFKNILLSGMAADILTQSRLRLIKNSEVYCDGNYTKRG